MKFEKGHTKALGRPRGSKNKIPTNIVERILKVTAELEKRGKGLSACAQKDPLWFYSNFLKGLIPKNVDLNIEGDLTIKWDNS